MDLKEFQKIKDLDYDRYVQYLLSKYGSAKADYFTKGFSPNAKCKRSKDGLFVHHIMEDRVPSLSAPGDAMLWPFEYQKKENLVYCDYLEHMWLHVLIALHPKSELVLDHDGLEMFLIPGLQAIYNGYKGRALWEKPIIDKVKHDKQVFDIMLDIYINEGLVSDLLLEESAI